MACCTSLGNKELCSLRSPAVSRREFLGTDEEFRRIDTDGDGLIDVKEAEAATRAGLR